jgi:hypothetical protein
VFGDESKEKNYAGEVEPVAAGRTVCYHKLKQALRNRPAFVLIKVRYNFRLMRYTALLWILLPFFAATQQPVEKFYDINWHESDAAHARYFSVVTQTESGFLRQDFFLPSQKLQMSGVYKDAECKISNGPFRYFYANGMPQSVGRYVNNKKEGNWLSFHPNGSMADSAHYREGNPVGIVLKWHPNGYVSDSLNYSAANVVKVGWFDNGQLSEAGRFDLSGKMIGKWKFFHKNGQLSAEEVYEQGHIVSHSYFTEKGEPVPEASDTTSNPVFKKGVNDWLNFLNRNLYWPIGYKLANTDIVQIRVEFTIGEDGSVSDILLACPFDPVFDDIVVKALKSSPKWHPAVSHNRNVSFRQRQLVGFRQTD